MISLAVRLTGFKLSNHFNECKSQQHKLLFQMCQIIFIVKEIAKKSQ